LGLTSSSTGFATSNFGDSSKNNKNVPTIALAGNPNVGKSTLFNRLTGLHQHTGNWPGKTVGSAYGHFRLDEKDYILADTPGSYSLMARSAEEEVARDAILFGESDKIVIVCDALSLERNLCLALSIMEVTGNVIICVNLMDEAIRNGIFIDSGLLQQQLGVPVIAMSAGTGDGVENLFSVLDKKSGKNPLNICYGQEIPMAIMPLTDYFALYDTGFPPSWLAMRFCEGDASMMKTLCKNIGVDTSDGEYALAYDKAMQNLASLDISPADLERITACALGEMSHRLCQTAITKCGNQNDRDRRLDSLITHRIWGWPVMAALIGVILWITIVGANYPSQMLSTVLFGLGDIIKTALLALHLPKILVSMLIDGVYSTTAWVTSVMLPPMAIFFPLFTLLEDFGYLPRMAFNLDGFFHKCNACGKQALTMTMGFGCNAAGVVGCRIIDSPRERLIAVLTNSFVPCNGRFPTLITVISLFFTSSKGSLFSAVILVGLVCLSVVMTLLYSHLLSVTLLKGEPSSFTLELPPYRRPRVKEVIVRSIFDRTLFVLLRAIKVAAPAGLLIWVLGNVNVSDSTLLTYLCGFFDAPAGIFGLNGAILLAFIIGLPANEIVVPIMLMGYLSGSTLASFADLPIAGEMLVANGWTVITAICVLIFTLFHWPCSTTLITIKKETGSVFYTVLAAVLPTSCGLILCLIVASAGKLFGF